MYPVIGIWGGASRIYATIKFIYTLVGSLLMLLAILALAFTYQGHNDCDWTGAVAWEPWVGYVAAFTTIFAAAFLFYKV